MTVTRIFQTTLAALLISSSTVFAQPPAAAAAAAPAPPPAFVTQAEAQLRSGHLDQALAVYRGVLQTSSDSFEANLGAGVVLDLMGQVAAARTNLEKAIQAAKTPAARTRAEDAMMVSFAFQNDCTGAVKYVSVMYNRDLDAGQYGAAGQMASRLGQLCLDAGDFDAAQQWFRMGYAATLQQPKLMPPAQNQLDFEWNAAMAQIDAAQGKRADKVQPPPKGTGNISAAQYATEQETAENRVKAARLVLAKDAGANKAQLEAFLTGSVAFYEGDYKTAAADLQKADQADPLVLALAAQAYEKLGDKAQATQVYQKIMASTAHTVTNAYARLLAAKAGQK